MSTSLDSLPTDDDFVDSPAFTIKLHNKQNKKSRSILKAKENVKSKCIKHLKKKLKKYKLRKDETEDPDILDVSAVLSTSLNIKSPLKKYCLSKEINKKDDLMVEKNYLVKMTKAEDKLEKASGRVGSKKGKNNHKNSSEHMDHKQSLKSETNGISNSNNSKTSASNPGESHNDNIKNANETLQPSEISDEKAAGHSKTVVNSIGRSPKKIETLDCNIKKPKQTKLPEGDGKKSFKKRKTTNHTDKIAVNKQELQESKNGKIIVKKPSDQSNTSPKSNCTFENNDKNHKNAFQLMMNARNKSLGRNSPGKDVPNDDEVPIEVLVKKHEKAKRVLALEKLAKSKGSDKNKELEIVKDEIIKNKMDKRAERLKSMLTKSEIERSSKESDVQNGINNEKKRISLKRRRTSESKNDLSKKIKTDAILSESVNSNACTETNLEKNIVIIEIAEETTNIKINDKSNIKETEERVLKIMESSNIIEAICKNAKVQSKKKQGKTQMSPEDEEFYDKLGPSIRKKESMLSYFQKIEKIDTYCSEDSNVELPENSPPKKTFKKKRKYTKRNKVLEKSKSEVINVTVTPIKNKNNYNNYDAGKKSTILNDTENNSTILKPKARIKHKQINTSEDTNGSLATHRPKRNAKKPLKYLEISSTSDTSSDDEPIFTPKKKNKDEKRQLVTPLKIINVSSPKDSKVIRSPRSTTKRLDKLFDKKQPSKNSTKLAPIFASKPQLDKATVEARQKFLKSGVPEQLKKIIERQKKCFCRKQ